MFERFTDKARRVLVIAQDEARVLEHAFIRPEHFLLGLAKGEGIASTALNEAGLSYALIRQRVAGTIPATLNADRLKKIPFSPQAKKTLELSLREALQLGHRYIGTEHLLLALLRGAEARDAADSRLRDLIGDLAPQLRARVIELVSGASGAARLRSPALVEATDRARRVAGQGVMTTGHLVMAILSDPDSQASRAFAALGLEPEAVAAALAQVGIAGTTDAVPTPVVEVKIGGVSSTIEDPDLAAALEGLTADEVRAALKRAFGLGPEQKATGSEG